MDPKTKRAELLKAAQAIVNGAKASDRDLTADEIADIEGKTNEIKSLDELIERQAKGAELMAKLGGLKPNEETPKPSNEQDAKTLGEYFVKTVGEQLKGKKGSRFSVSSPEFKANTDVHVTGGADGVFGPYLTTVDTNLVIGVRRRLTVADLLGTETISGTAITYFVEGPADGDFATVPENGAKPQIHFGDPTPVTEALTKIAAFIKESDEISEDLPWYVSAINGRLLYKLGVFEEDQLLVGDGTGTNLTGILNRSGVQTEVAANAADNPDAIFRAITKVPIGSDLDADGLVINPVDYQNLRLAKDGNGQYFGGGFFSGQYGQGGVVEQPPVWGLRTVVTPAIAAGTALVGSFAQAASVIRKGGVRVESTNSDTDDFTNNRITVRAEERLALAVRVPAGFVKVTLPAAA